MIQTIVGAVLLALPFLLIQRFSNKICAFYAIFLVTVIVHLCIGFLAQLFHVFFYLLILEVYIVCLVLAFIQFNPFKDLGSSLKGLENIDTVLIFLLGTCCIYLGSFHYNYTGPVQTALSPVYQSMSHLNYPYPYYSDEWISVALIKDIIGNNTLPIRNPFHHVFLPFTNFGIMFYSFLAEVSLFLGLDPLVDYTKMALAVGVLICLTVYLILRNDKVNKLVAAITAISILYITNSANLPGIWYLIPLILGLLFFLISLLYLSSRKIGWSLIAAFLATLFYPPLCIFYIPAIMTVLISDKNIESNVKIRWFSILGGSITFAGLLIASSFFMAEGSFQNFFSLLMRSRLKFENLTGKLVPQYPIWLIIPIPVLVLSAIGVIKVWKDKFWLLSVIMTGFAFWVLYTHWNYRVLIDFQRVILITSVMIVLLSGYGLHLVFEKLSQVKYLKDTSVLQIVLCLVLAIFFVRGFGFTKRESSIKLRLVHEDTGKLFAPAAPANIYLTDHDLRIFSSLERKNFLSLPWKGTVIGAATSNFPMTMKASTISQNRFLYNEFIRGTCGKKNFLARYQGINYVYSTPFDCSGFEPLDRSPEGFVLYKTKISN